MSTMFLISILGLLGCNKGVHTPQTPAAASAPTFHSLSATDIHGKPVNMADFKGRKVMVVNTASECGYTPQYAQLQELYAAYKDKGFVILGFPCNQFGSQEPGDAATIESFCQKNYGVTFPLMEKVEVKGERQHPVYKWLTSAALNGSMDAGIKWNFHKFLVDEQGHVAMSLGSGVSPLDPRVTDWLDGK